LRYEKEWETCLNCNGVCKKSGSSKGVMPIIVVENDTVYEAVKLCSYEKERREQARINRLFASAGVPKLYESIGFDKYEATPDNQEAIKAAHWVIGDDNGQGLFIYGPRGTGKTMLASIIANERMKQGKPVLFASVPDLLGDIRASFKSGNTDEAMQSVKEAAFLVLDDLGAEKMTEWVSEQLFAIINHRYNEKLQTVITSNFDAKNIIRRMSIVDRAGNIIDDMQGERIMSRIFGMCQMVHLGGKDYRAKGEAL